MSIDHDTFKGLAFPVAKVRYAGPTDSRGGRFIASIRRGDDTFRATRAYRYEESEGAAQAVHAATLALEKALATIDWGETPKVSDYIAVPGDLSADSYSFTFVPRHFFE